VSAALSSVPRVYPWLGFCAGYVILLLFNPVRSALRDGLRCVARYKRLWLTFALFGLAYSIFQFATFSPVQSSADFDLNQMATLPTWHLPRLAEVWTEIPLPALEGVAGLFDEAVTTYPLSVAAAILLILNWRGFHADLWRALRRRFSIAGFFIYFVVLLSALASVFKPIMFWWLPFGARAMSEARLLQISASVDAAAFIFEYLFGVYIQVYLITVCLAWVKGVSFNEQSLFEFAVRRFAFVLKWAGLVVLVGLLFVRIPLLLAYFMRVPDVLDYLPMQRLFMCILIIAFASVQVSLALHNENLFEAIGAHAQFIVRNFYRFSWFLLICALHFVFLMACDALARAAIADRMVALIIWKCGFVCARGFVAGWLLASWVVLFRQSERGRVHQEHWIRY
jgi:hypothetical protein